MSTSTIAPAPVETPATKLHFENLARPGGFYDGVGKQVMAMGHSAMSEATYSTDFFRVLDWGKNYKYHDRHDPQRGPYVTNFVGQIAPFSSGTMLGAKGNHYAGNNGQVCPSLVSSIISLLIGTLLPGRIFPSTTTARLKISLLSPA